MGNLENSVKTRWYKDSVVYQIYPRSFKDGNGDGIGDLRGVIEKLDYLKELGITAVWLSPCYKSPNADNGYDISDYRDIMDEFGTLDDWKEMVQGLHERGIKLIMDLGRDGGTGERDRRRTGEPLRRCGQCDPRVSLRHAGHGGRDARRCAQLPHKHAPGHARPGRRGRRDDPRRGGNLRRIGLRPRGRDRGGGRGRGGHGLRRQRRLPRVLAAGRRGVVEGPLRLQRRVRV